MMSIKTAVLLSAILPLALRAQTPATLPAHIVVIRHAEKQPDPNPHLSAEGVARAQRLVTYVTTDPVITKLGTPVAIFATRSTKDGNGIRTQETVTPLAKALKLPVLTPELGKNYPAAASLILSNPAYAGKTVFVCWNHEWIPQLMKALGVRPKPAKWKGSVFDLVYIISYPGGKATVSTARYR